MTVAIRPAAPGDVPAIKALLRSAGLPDAGITSHGVALWVAGNEDLVGTVAVERHGSDGLLRSLAVAPAFRDRGLGTRLCEVAVTYARADGLDALYLLTTTADRFFARLGFRRTDRTSVPDAIAASGEFAELCPSDAVCFSLRL